MKSEKPSNHFLVHMIDFHLLANAVLTALLIYSCYRWAHNLLPIVESRGKSISAFAKIFHHKNNSKILDGIANIASNNASVMS